MQVDLPLTPLGKALASGEAIRSWIRKNILKELQEYVQTGEVHSRKGTVHYWLDALDASQKSESDIEQKLVVSFS